METNVLSIEQMAAKIVADAPPAEPQNGVTTPETPTSEDGQGSWRDANVSEETPPAASVPAETDEEKAELARLKAELEAKEKELAELKEKAIILDDPEKLKEIANLVHPSTYESDEDLIRAVCAEKGLDDDDTEAEVEYITGLRSPLEKKTRIEAYRKMLAESYDAKVAKFVPKSATSQQAQGSAPANETALPPAAKQLFDQSMTSLGETMDALNGIELDGVKFTPTRTREIYDLASENLHLQRYWEMKDGRPTGKLNIDQAVRDAIVVKYGDIMQKARIKEAESQGLLKAAFLKFRPSAGSGGGGSLDNLSVDDAASKKAFEAARMSFGGPAVRRG